MAKLIPSFDLYKKLENILSFDFERLEKSYHEYDASHPHRHNYYELLFFNNTGGYHEIDFKKHPVTANTVHLITPEQVHVLRRKRNVTGHVVSFTAELFLLINQNADFLYSFPFFQTTGALPVVQLTPAGAKSLASIVNQIETEFKSNNTDKKEMLAFLTGQLLLILKRNYKAKGIDHGTNDLITRFKELVNQHFKKNRSVSHYAELMAITPGHLNDTVKKMTGKTAGSIIHERVLLEAKRLLYHSHLSIKEIAIQLNFEDPSYFNRFFRTHAGSTPEQFRNSIREKYH